MAEHIRVSLDEHIRRNPSQKQAMEGPEKEQWLTAKAKEDSFLEQRGTFLDLPNQYDDLPQGAKVLHIITKFKIKDDGTYKAREVILGNHDNWNGDCFSSTVSKPIVWLIFALTVLLGLCTRWFDNLWSILSRSAIKGNLRNVESTRETLNEEPLRFGRRTEAI